MQYSVVSSKRTEQKKLYKNSIKMFLVQKGGVKQFCQAKAPIGGRFSIPEIKCQNLSHTFLPTICGIQFLRALPMFMITISWESLKALENSLLPYRRAYRKETSQRRSRRGQAWRPPYGFQWRRRNSRSPEVGILNLVSLNFKTSFLCHKFNMGEPLNFSYLYLIGLIGCLQT